MTNATQTREWGVLLKTRTARDAPAPGRDQLSRLLAALPGSDKTLTGEGRDFTVALWVEAPDAVVATTIAAKTVRQIARMERLVDLTFVRSHAASVEGRFPDAPQMDPEMDPAKAWAVDFKVLAPAGVAPMTPELLDGVRESMGGSGVSVTLRGDPEKFLLDDGSGFTIRFWAMGDAATSAISEARRRLLAALSEAGLGDWLLVRFKGWAPLQKQQDTFPGAAARTPAVTEETR